MKYPNDTEAHLGDIVQLGDSEIHEGVVVCSLDTHEYSMEFPEKDWGYLGQGILVKFDRLGLIHYREPEPTLILLHRAASVEQ